MNKKTKRKTIKEKTVTKETTLTAMKTWFGNGEVDIDHMISIGILTNEQVIKYCETIKDSPWYKSKK